ncbi:MAG: carboxypeptidase regulatory-like domain-containing protein [Thermoanaerobaculia bacterium]
MHFSTLRRLSCLALVATFFAAAPTYAGKRRAVKHPTAGAQLNAELSGTVIDNVTGLPVINARVKAGRDSDTTDSQGKFLLKEVVGYGVITVEASRTGYTAKTITLSTGGKQTLDIRLQPGPTVSVRKLDGTSFNIDFDSLEFGYVVTFGGYHSAEFEDFCKPDGSQVAIDRSQIKRIVGPSTPVTATACCTQRNTVKVNVELKTGEKSDMYFIDACNGYPDIDLLGRDHVSGKMQYIPFAQIAEIVFP